MRSARLAQHVRACADSGYDLTRFLADERASKLRDLANAPTKDCPAPEIVSGCLDEEDDFPSWCFRVRASFPVAHASCETREAFSGMPWSTTARGLTTTSSSGLWP
ncbi:hypothetical protein [Segniliparus rugosus]|nr:hypothetical protein [Segniliparus rugosus]